MYHDVVIVYIYYALYVCSWHIQFKNTEICKFDTSWSNNNVKNKTCLACWRHDLKAPSTSLGLYAGNQLATGRSWNKSPIMRSVNGAFVVNAIKAFNKQSDGKWNRIPKHACDSILMHDDVIKWRHFPRYWPFVRGIHRSPVNSPHKGQWRGVWCFLWSASE